jgi:tetratricopeptide (TPR) repeat protein
MPKTIKKKTAKKKTVQEEEVKGFALDALDSIKEKQKQLIISAVAIAALVALYMTISMYSSSLMGDALDVEMEANDYYYAEVVESSISDDERLKKALELYRKSVEIKVTPTALYNLGNTYYRLGDYGSAVEQYELFVDKFGSSKEMLPLVYQKMAASCLRTGQNDKAFGALEKLSQIDGGIFRDTALVLEARYLENAGEAEKSLEKYRELAAEFPSSTWSAEAVSKLPSAKAEDAGDKVEAEAAPEAKTEEDDSGDIKEEQ